MGKSDPEQAQSSRKQTLNIIYFVDSSRTRSLKIPLGRAQLTLFFALATMVWAVGSGFLLFRAHKDNDGLTRSLRASMATTFEYETRYEGVYEIAYPGKGGGSDDPGDLVSSTMSKAEREAKESAEIAAAAAEAAKEVLAADSAVPVPIAKDKTKDAREAKLAKEKEARETKLAKEKEAREAKLAKEKEAREAKLAQEAAKALKVKEALEAKAVQAAAMQKLAAKAPPSAAPPAPEEEPIGGNRSPILVGNPVIQTATDALQLNFDLTNKSNDRAEGYIWAVAEFRNDKGELSYIADPPAIAVQSDGEPSQLLRSSNFGIRKFKKMSFSFPVQKAQSGTFTGIKIGVTDKTGANRMTYNVPVEIKVGTGTR